MKAIIIYLSSLCVVAAIIFGSVAYSLWQKDNFQATKVLRFAYPEDPNTIHPLNANDSVSTAFMQYTYEAMATRSYVEPDVWIPSLATHWEIEEEGEGIKRKIKYTIHLRKGVKWQPIDLPKASGQGKPQTLTGTLTAHDVKFTFDCILNKYVQAPHWRMSYTDEKPEDPNWPYKIRYRVVDDYTFEVVWQKPHFTATSQTLGVLVIPKHVFSIDENGNPIASDVMSKEFADGFNKHWASEMMCGTGPMKFREWKAEQLFILDRFDDYWGEPFAFDTVRYEALSTENTCIAKLLNGWIDTTAFLLYSSYERAKKHEAVKTGRIKLTDFLRPSYRYVGYNLNQPLFEDKRVRWALSHAIPVDKAIKDIWKGMALRLTGPSLPGSPKYNSDLPPITFDLKKAKQLLDEAGWKDTNNDGVRDKVINGKRVDAKYKLMIFNSGSKYAQLASLIKETNRKIGIEVSVQKEVWTVMLDKMDRKDFDAVILGWSLSWEGNPKQLWSSSEADEPASGNFVAYKSKEADKIIDEIQTTTNREKLNKLFREFHKQIYDDQPYSFLFQDKMMFGYNTRLKRVNFYKIRPCYAVGEWYVGDVEPPLPTDTMPIKELPAAIRKLNDLPVGVSPKKKSQAKK